MKQSKKAGGLGGDQGRLGVGTILARLIIRQRGTQTKPNLRFFAVMPFAVLTPHKPLWRFFVGAHGFFPFLGIEG